MNELLMYALDSGGKQVEAAVTGMSDEQINQHLAGVHMSPAEMLVHMSECYQAVIDELEGREHEWGSYKEDNMSSAHLIATWKSMRANAIAALGESNNEKAGKLAIGFIVLHDAYHVGQIVSCRLAVQPDWNYYSIYGSE